MKKGTAKLRSFVHSKDESTSKAKEARCTTSPARPPLSAFSASARNNLSAGNVSPTHPASNSQAKFDRRKSQVKIRGRLSGQVSYPQSENADSNVTSNSSSNSSSPERFSASSETLLKGKSKRSGGGQVPLGSADLGNVQPQNSTGMAILFDNLPSPMSLKFEPRTATIFTRGAYTIIRQ
jgi:hypothetical protein